MSTTMLKRDLRTGGLCDNIGLVGVSAKWSYIPPSHHVQAIPILSPLLFMHVGHPYIPLLIYLYYRLHNRDTGNGSNLRAIRVVPKSILRPHPLNICACFYVFYNGKTNVDALDF